MSVMWHKKNNTYDLVKKKTNQNVKIINSQTKLDN